MIDREKINTPHVYMTKEAARQLELMFEHDHTLDNKVIRIQISGKGCSGFKYELGFTEIMDEDLTCQTNISIPVHMVPFSAFYLEECEVKYEVSTHGEDGFSIENLNQKQFTGKFWRNDETKIAPQLNP